MDLIKEYEAERMTEGKKIEARGIEERKEFLSKYPITDIQKLTIEQYALGDGSFSYWLCYRLRNFASMGDTRPTAFGVYTTKEKGSQILLSKSCEKKLWF